ncbi:GntP family permease [bacterium]|nr:GntP family permease [bacterium]
MQLLIVLLALFLLMGVAYRGLSVILFAPVCALLAVLLSLGPTAVLPFYSNVFMVKLVGFVQLYFPVFLLGAVFGKFVEMSGAAAAISAAIVNRLGERQIMLAIVLACAVLTYGGVSLFVVAFAVYPLANNLFYKAQLPKRLIPGTIALGSFTFTMDALPGTPQIQNVIPTTFFGTDLYAAPLLGCSGALFVLVCGMWYLHRQAQRAFANREGYGEHSLESLQERKLPHFALALLPLLVVAVLNLKLGPLLKGHYGETFDFSSLGLPEDGSVDVKKLSGIWSIEIALCAGILSCLLVGLRDIQFKLQEGLRTAVAGALLATMNTASEYGFGGVIASLPGFTLVKNFLGGAFSDPLINEAISVNALAGITGSASGGLSLALAALGSQFQAGGQVPAPVLHRVASMASGGMDTLPHNGAVITLLLVTGLTHKDSYKDIFVITCLKTAAVFVVIFIYRSTGLY